MEFGIGTVLAVEGRRVTVLYRAVMETRVYAVQSAPLTRVRFEIGDEIATNDGTVVVICGIAENEHGVITYSGQAADGTIIEVNEVDIDHHLAIHDPVSRLLNGQIDNPRWFTLRLLARQFEGLVWQSPVRGLQGARMSLVPHQLYIADQISRHRNARALLADEVGLGKTIEACLVLHRQIVQGLCARALVIVPQALVNQWLVELLRRFNLSFSVYDEDRCLEMETEGDNPFVLSQFILCSLSLFDNPSRLQQALEAGWDMLIVDEAHHLHWTPEQSGDDYRCVELLSQQTPSVLLLTATPEQLGRESHFARLRLLDPERFNSLERFIAEEEAFEPVADLAEAILETDESSEPLVARLADYGIHSDAQRIANDRQSIARQLVDLHGTSRLLFRNTRNTISGFPERMLQTYPLQYSADLPASIESAVYETILDADPRIPWLIDTIRALRPEKCLLICSSPETALFLENHLQKREGIRSSAFHEGLSIIQRDRAAAWFAEDNGADVLLCSEIGSEGRNFQFAHHLILFDLPLNPDLLEQRIGRLDRIGQREQVHLHVPFIEHSAHQGLLEWYRQVTMVFAAPDPVATSVFEHDTGFKQALVSAHRSDLQAAIASDRAFAKQLRDNMQKGRERLLSLSSFDQRQARQIVNEIQIIDRDRRLQPFMDQVFDLFGVDSEHHSEYREVVRPGDHRVGGQLPLLDEEGTLITYDRDTALVHEDTQFLTWDHPMVTGALDAVTSGEFGTSTLSLVHHDQLPAGTSLLELIYRIDCPAPAELPVRRYIDEPVLRLLLDDKGRNLAEQLPHEQLTDTAQLIDKATAARAIKAQARQIGELIEGSQALARQKLQTVLKRTRENLQRHTDEEVQRLRVLMQTNPNLGDKDIDNRVQYRDDLLQLLGKASIVLDAARLVVVSD
jgi:ATP-dependent helicase HepA